MSLGKAATVHLLESGNLVIKNSSNDIVWESFDSPTPCFLRRPLPKLRSWCQATTTCTMIMTMSCASSMMGHRSQASTGLIQITMYSEMDRQDTTTPGLQSSTKWVVSF
jgi:hypothetical protein